MIKIDKDFFKIDYNYFSDVNPDNIQPADFTEDMLLMKFKTDTNYSINCSYYDEYKGGIFVILLIKNNNYNSPIKRVEIKDSLMIEAEIKKLQKLLLKL